VGPDLPLVLRRLRGGVDGFHLHAPNPTLRLAPSTTGVSAALVATHQSDVIRPGWVGCFGRSRRGRAGVRTAC
jgi:hypothetical protein